MRSGRIRLARKRFQSTLEMLVSNACRIRRIYENVLLGAKFHLHIAGVINYHIENELTQLIGEDSGTGVQKRIGL